MRIKTKPCESNCESELTEQQQLVLDAIVKNNNIIANQIDSNTGKATDNDHVNDHVNDPVNDHVNDPVNDPVKQLLTLISERPQFSYEEYAQIMNISRATIKRYIAKLKQQGKIRRIGSDKTRHWEVVVND